MLYEKLENDEIVVLSSCRNLIEAMPQLVQDPDAPEDVLKVDGKADDCYDGFTMGLHNWDTVKAMPFAVKVERSVETTRTETLKRTGSLSEAHTAAHMTHLKMTQSRKATPRFGRQHDFS